MEGNILNPTEMTYQDRLIIKDTCDKIIRCMSQLNKYTKKELMNGNYLDDYENYEDFKKSTSIPIYSYRNENPLNGLCEVEPYSTDRRLYEGGVDRRSVSLILLFHDKNDHLNPSKHDRSWSFPVGRFTKNNNIYNAVFACDLFYAHFNTDGVELLKGEVAQMLLEEYRKEPLFIKDAA